MEAENREDEPTGLAEGLLPRADGTAGCWWAGEGDVLYREYHDVEWGRPTTGDIALFEKVCLEGFQAGLSWLTILRKRENFREAFAGFDPVIVAGFTARDVERLVQNAGIIRHRGKIEATINNAQRAIEMLEEYPSLGAYFWSFEPTVADRPTVVDFAAASLLTTSPESIALSRDLKSRGWKFVGPTTMYALMQAMGLVNDHLEGCSARSEVEAERSALVRPS